jgi:membrane protein required for colicin V production
MDGRPRLGGHRFAAFLVLSVLVGLMRGFVFELLSLAGWFAAYFVGLWWTPSFQPHVHVGAPGSTLNYGRDVRMCGSSSR